MDNQFIIDSSNLPTNIQNKKRQLENDPKTRINHMEYLSDMEQIKSDIQVKVLNQSKRRKNVFLI